MGANEKVLNDSMMEIGDTGLKRYGDQIYEEFLPQLSSDKFLRVYSEMNNNDPVIGGMLFAIEMLVRQAKFRIEPVSADGVDREVSDFVKTCLDDMTSDMIDTIAEILTMLPFGWALHELVYRYRRGEQTGSAHDDGLIGWKKIAPRAQDTRYGWKFDEQGETTAFVQLPPPSFTERTIPMEKALLFRVRSRKNNPEGVSVLRNAYRPWYFKKRIEEIEAIGIERDLAGLPTAWVPKRIMSSSASAEEKALYALIKEITRSIRRDQREALVFPLEYDANGKKLFEFQLMSSGGSRQFDTNAIIGRYDQRIAMTMLADFILLGHETVGSFALSSDKTRLFSVALGAWLDAICGVFNKFAIPRLIKMNPFRVKKYPKLVHGDIETPNLAELGAFITALSGAGAQLFPDKELESYIRRAAGLPLNSGENPLIDAKAAAEEEEARALAAKQNAE